MLRCDETQCSNDGMPVVGRLRELMVVIAIDRESIEDRSYSCANLLLFLYLVRKFR